MRLIFDDELFYEIEDSEDKSGYVDVIFMFNDIKQGNKDIPLSIPKSFFVNYEDLDTISLARFKEKELKKILLYAENIEDYTKCSDIKYVLEKINI